MSKISISDLNKSLQLSELSNTEISRINGGEVKSVKLTLSAEITFGPKK